MSISLFAIKSFIDDWPQKSFLHEIIWQLHCGIDIESSPLQCTEEDSYFSFLPLAHVYDQIIESYCIYKGSSIGFWRGVRLRFISLNEFSLPSIYLTVCLWLPMLNLSNVFFVALNLQDIRFLMEDIQELKPSMFCGVPRVYDRIYSGILFFYTSHWIICIYIYIYIFFFFHSKRWP